MKARDIMTNDPTCCTPDTTAQRAARLMEEHDCGGLPVCEGNGGNRVIGMVTDRDLALRVLGRGLSPDTPVREAMSRNVVSCRLEDDLEKVELLMAEHQLRRLLVLDAQGHCVGIIAQADLARHRKEVGEKDFSKVVERISEPARVSV